MGKVKYDGISFDSELEVEYYKHLCELKNKGEILGFTYHPSVPIAVTKNNNYYPDFVVVYDDRIEIVETKGYSQFSFMKDNMVHNIMLQKTEQELKDWLLKNGLGVWLYLPVGMRKVIYKKIKFLKSFGWVDFDFKNPNTIANKRKEKINEQKEEIKELREFKKNAERYFSYHLKLVNNKKLSKPQREWYNSYVEHLQQEYSNEGEGRL